MAPSTNSVSDTASTVTATALFCMSVVGGILLSKQITKEVQISSISALEESSTDKTEDVKETSNTETPGRILSPGNITIAYASTTGSCLKMAHELHDKMATLLNDEESKPDIQIQPIHKFDWWDEFLNDENELNNNTATKDSKTNPPILILVLPTWTNGTLPPPVANNKSLDTPFPNLLDSLHEITTDWRVPKKALASSNLTVSVFGLGSSEYDPKTFCKPAKDIHRLLIGKLGSKRLINRSDATKAGKRNWNLAMGDESIGDVDKTVFKPWMDKVVAGVLDLYFPLKKSKKSKNRKSSKNSKEVEDGCGCGNEKEDEGCCKSSTNPQAGSASGGSSSEDEYDSSDNEGSDDEEDEPGVMDMEDMGNEMSKSKSKANPSEPPEMVTAKQAVALKKEGYKLIGTHSAVKLCRWTKHQLRGRGGCYKHTFYGITSYQCMESTPSLACANKCVFCWRHHKNPVGTTWRWKTDDPYQIVAESVDAHVRMIKETKGIPGVLPNRWKEAHTVKHCALSLVGEPIMYPRIDDFLGELHRRKISSFLVTNGQHPEAIESIRPITQLYVSVDAPTPESLDAIDRPLFKDAWERLRRSLKCLKEKGQRTVARLTVVKGWNSDEIGGYAELIALGHCSLVEVKGVTFCGKSDASNLNMTNTPWHHEVVDLVKSLQKELSRLTAKGGPNAPPLYGLACEHKHSCSVLLARVDQFSYTDPATGEMKWRTWIDYEKFQELAEKHRLDPTFTFGVEDYTADTPDWALSGAEEEGFDPTDTRHFRKKKLYTSFDKDGVPTNDKDGAKIGEEERARLRALMEEKRREHGMNDGNVREGKGGEKEVVDVSLMFRGMVVGKQQ